MKEEERFMTLKRSYMKAAVDVHGTSDIEFEDPTIDWQVDRGVQLVNIEGEKYAWVRAWVRVTDEERKEQEGSE